VDGYPQRSAVGGYHLDPGEFILASTEQVFNLPAGWREYKRRIEIMVQRQRFKCCLCKNRISVADATFEHQRRRGLHAAFRDDRIEGNGAAHWICNRQRG
jgi:hypothetical protein